MGKQSKTLYAKRRGRRAQELLELVYTDLCGPMDVKSVDRAKYFITFIDNTTRKTFGYFLKHKNEALNVFNNFKELVEKQSGHKIKILRSNNKREFVNKYFD